MPTLGASALRPLALALWVGSLGLALLDDRGAWLPFALSLALCAALAAWSARDAPLRWPLLATLIALGLLLFGAAERTRLSVDVVGDRLAVSVDETRLSGGRIGSIRSIALLVEPYERSRAAVGTRSPLTARVLGATLDWMLNGGQLSGVTAIQASGTARDTPDPAAVLWQPRIRGQQPSFDGGPISAQPIEGPEGIYHQVAVATGDAFSFQLDVLRSGTPVRVLLIGPDGQSQILLHPEQSTLTVFRVSNDRKLTRVSGGFQSFHKSLLPASQQLARLVGRTVLNALALVALLLLGGAAIGRFVRLRALPRVERRLGLAIATAFGAGGLVVTGYVASEILERMPHVQDSVAYLFQARTFAAGQLWVPTPPVEKAFVEEFVVMHDGRWFSKYPPGHPLLLALGVLAGIPWLVGPIAAGLTLVVSYLLARELYGGMVALTTQVLLLFSPFFLFLSGTMMSHPTSLLFAVLFVWLLALAERRDAPLLALLAGLSAGMLFAGRPLTAVALCVPFLVWVADSVSRSGRIRPRHLALAAGGIVPALAILAYNRELTGAWFSAPFELWWAFDKIGFGPSVGRYGGHYFAWGFTNVWSLLAELKRWLFGWPVGLTLAFALVPFVSGTRRHWDWLLGAAAVSVFSVHVLYWATGLTLGPRYYYELLAILAMLSARGMVQIGSLARRVWPRVPASGMAARWLALATMGVLIAVTAIWYNPDYLRRLRGFNGMNGRNLEAVGQGRFLNALVLVAPTDPPSWQSYGSVFWANSPFLDGDVIFARDLGAESNRALARAFPDRALYRLENRRLRPYSVHGDDPTEPESGSDSADSTPSTPEPDD